MINIGVLFEGEFIEISCILSSSSMVSIRPNPTVYLINMFASSTTSFCLSLIFLNSAISSIKSDEMLKKTSLNFPGSIKSFDSGLCSEITSFARFNILYLSSDKVNSTGVM